MESMYEFSEVQRILESNKDKKFVQRILEPDKYGVLDNNDGTHSTHSMVWGHVGDGEYAVFPTVVRDGKGGFRRLSKKESWDNAMDNNECIRFDSAEKAEWFSKQYKKYWDGTGKRPKP